MYDTDYGTDWTTLDREEALERAFALGVTAVVAEPRRDELERVRDAVDTTYDRTMVDLAFEEGQKRAGDAAPEAPEDVWDSVVEGEGDADDVAGVAPPDRDDGLPAVLDGLDVLDGGVPERFGGLDLPDVLRRK
ncbi:MAG: hypothetical protein ABEJ70_07355 [Halobacteriaceae archaeon]